MGCNLPTPLAGGQAITFNGSQASDVGSIPIARSSYLVSLQQLSDWSRRQKAALRNKMSLLGGTGSSGLLKHSVFSVDQGVSESIREERLGLLSALARSTVGLFNRTPHALFDPAWPRRRDHCQANATLTPPGAPVGRRDTVILFDETAAASWSIRFKPMAPPL